MISNTLHLLGRPRPVPLCCLGALVALALLILPAGAAITAVDSIGVVVGDLDRQAAFYTSVLSFEPEGEVVEAEGAQVERVYGLSGARTRSMTLRLGDERVVLTEFVQPRGRAVPSDSRSFDLWFQHVAIVVRDMDAAYAQLARHRVRHVSTAPQTLPASNPDAGGIRAFYFQDPEQHVLEIIWFPPGKGDPRWQMKSDRLFLGIDHTAIVVGDTERSLSFYRDALGLEIAGAAENFGTEQEHLNQVFGARLRITALRAAHGPGVEFLEYIAPPGGRPLPSDARLYDQLAWTIRFSTDDNGAPRVPATVGPGLARDPDGHLVHFLP